MVHHHQRSFFWLDVIVALHREDLHLKWLHVTRDCEREVMLTSASWCRRWCESFAHWVPPQTSSSEIWTWDERDRRTDLNMRHRISAISCNPVFFFLVSLLAHLSRLWKWYCLIGTSLKRNQTVHLLIITSLWISGCVSMIERQRALQCTNSCVDLAVVRGHTISMV